MTIWTPDLSHDGPRYLAIADAVARDLKDGHLNPGDRLPTHRHLAKALGVTVGTVSRGYAEAERRGLTVGEVGRGTFIRGSSQVASPAPWQGASDPWQEANMAHESLHAGEPQPDRVVDLTLSLPATLDEEGELFSKTLSEIAADPRAVDLLSYSPESGDHRQRSLAARWLSRLGLKVSAEEVLITAGSQHGLNVVLSSLFAPGLALAAEALTYPSIKSQARALGLRLRAVELDSEGLVPESLHEVCTQGPKPAAVYLVPTLQNPTVATMSESRRREIVKVAEQHDLWILEDDVHAFLPEHPSTPIAALAPERTIYLASVAKCLAPGLRTGYLLAPAPLRGRLLAGIHTTLWMAPPLTVEVTSRWLEDGTADHLIQKKREDTARRRKLALEIFADLPEGSVLHSDPAAYHLWLELPDPLCVDEVVSQARERGIHVLGAGVFAIGRTYLPHALRLSIAVPGRLPLERALKGLAELISGRGAPGY